MLSSNYAVVKAIRFVQKGGSALPTIKLFLTTFAQTEEALTAGVFLDSIFYRPIRFEQGIKIKRCFKCQKFGHVKVNCKSKQSCGYYCEEHDFKVCPSKSKPPNAQTVTKSILQTRNTDLFSSNSH